MAATTYDCTQTIQVEDGLCIRPYSKTDVAKLYNLIENEKDDLFWIHSINTMENIADLHAEIDRVNEALKASTRLGGAVELGGKVAGTCRISGIKVGDTGDLGYWLFKSYRGKGIITKCCKSLLDIAFTELRLGTVTVCAATVNQASRATPERLGFRLAEIREKCLLRSDKWWEGAIYVMDRSNWEIQIRG